MVLTFSPIKSFVKFVHPRNTWAYAQPICVQFSALKANEISPVQLVKASSPMAVTLLGIEIEVSPVQPENAQPPIVVTELGMVRVVSPEQSLKMPFGIVATL